LNQLEGHRKRLERAFNDGFPVLAEAIFMFGMINCHTMSKSKIAITVSPLVLKRLDAWVQSEHYASRSEAIEKAIEAQLQRLERTRLSEQCALLDVDEEQATADVGLALDAAAWPAF
jgi:Arc/MetJ-type ribon-helix-helix transcriptional regulator